MGLGLLSLLVIPHRRFRPRLSRLLTESTESVESEEELKSIAFHFSADSWVLFKCLTKSESMHVSHVFLFYWCNNDAEFAACFVAISLSFPFTHRALRIFLNFWCVWILMGSTRKKAESWGRLSGSTCHYSWTFGSCDASWICVLPFSLFTPLPFIRYHH